MELLYLFHIFIYMGRKQKKYHYIYKTTNVINNKYYIGMHSTNDLDDGYIGSGKRLWNSINYHGKENHVCEILEYCDNREELKQREREIVNEQLLTEDLCMNLMVGGQGGFRDEEHQKKCSKAGAKAMKDKLKNDLVFLKKHSERISKLTKERMEKGDFVLRCDWNGRKHSEESKQKMSEAKKGKYKGKKHPQYGSCWITNEVENRKIKKGDPIPEGWRLGRKMK